MKKIKYLFLPILFTIVVACTPPGTVDPVITIDPVIVITVSEIEITAISVDSTSITVTWTDPIGPGLDHIKGLCSDGTDVEIPAAAQTYTFEALTPDTNYSITFTTVYSDAQTSTGNQITASTTINGTSNHTVITTAAELNNIRNGRYGQYLLTADINLSDYQAGNGWVPIGNSTDYFYGTLNGNGHTISGLFIDNDAEDNLGLFGYCYGVELCNINIENADITGQSYIGTLTGTAIINSTIINCISSGSVTGSTNLGGLAGNINIADIRNSHSTASVSGLSRAGGFVGAFSAGTIDNCYATGTVNASGSYAGGLTGSSYGTIKNCYATGSVTSGANYAGGLVGFNSGPIQDSYATGSVISVTGYTGGLAGFNQDTIERSYAIGSVRSGANTGGLVGYNFGNISNSYATGSVTASGTFAGGLVGIIDGSTHYIENCYSSGLVTSTAGNYGGLLGIDFTGTIITNSFWDMESSAQVISAGGTGLSVSQMADSSNFTGWDFTDIWDIDSSINGGYPFLRTTP